MSRFAPVCPIRILRQLEPASSGDYHLLLAHDVAANAAEYRQWFGQHRNMTVIMDNSVIELGNAVDLSVIKAACDIVEVTTIVLPDVLLNGKATVDSCSKALETWPGEFAPYLGDSYENGRRKRGFMYVPQGKTLAEFGSAAQALAEHPDINFWGIPRNLVAQIGTRRDATDLCFALNPNRRIHLLGFSDNIPDDVICARDRRVEGIDSAVPLRCRDPITFNSDPGPRGTWWEDVEYSPQMDNNISVYRKWIRR